MKVKVCAASSWNLDKHVIIEVNSIDEAINKIKTNKNLVSNIIGNTSWLYDENNSITIPNTFIIDTHEIKEYDILIQLYDRYVE